MVCGKSLSQRSESNGIRADNFPRIHCIGNSRRDSKIYDWITVWTWAVQKTVRKIYGRSPTDNLSDLDVNTAIRYTFMSVTLQAAVHLGQDFSENLQSNKNQPLDRLPNCPRLTGSSLCGEKHLCYVSSHQWRYCLNPYFETKQFLGFASWTKSSNTSQKRQRKFMFKALNLSVQGNL